MINFVQTQVYTVCSSKVCTVSLVYTKICKLNLNLVQTMINLIRMACAHGVKMEQTGFVQVPPQLHRLGRLHVHVVPPQEPGLPPNEAWLLVLRALVLTTALQRLLLRLSHLPAHHHALRSK